MKRNTFLKSLLVLPVIFSFSTPKVRKNKVITFTPEMLSKNNVGLYIINDKADVVKNPNYAATVAWKLSWNIMLAKNPKFKLGDKECGGEEFRIPTYGKVNFLTDGWYCPIGNKCEDICEYLNNNPYGEKFRIMTKEELFYIIENRTNTKQLFYE